jgi:benzoyl-CoA reductase subunit C
MFAEFRDLLEHRHEHARALKAQGRKIVGYFCTYTPEELIYAAGAVPVRIMSTEEQIDLADAHVQAFFCPFARSCLEQGLLGRYDYLDGIVFAYACDTLRGVYESWVQNVPVFYSNFVGVPARVDTPTSRRFMIRELQRFKRSLETELVGGPIADDRLREAIARYNAGRAMMRRLYELRLGERPPVSGHETLEVVLASMVSPKEWHNALLAALLDKLPTRQPAARGEVRLMVVGSELDSPRLLRFFEEKLGVLVVADDLCTGSRYLWTDVAEDGDPLAAIASRYLDKVTCPTKHPPERRLQHILSEVQRARVHGVAVVHQKFCDPHDFDYPMIEQALRAIDIPVVYFDVENTFAEGQVMTRVQAFLEMLEEAALIG